MVLSLDLRVTFLFPEKLFSQHIRFAPTGPTRVAFLVIRKFDFIMGDSTSESSLLGTSVRI